MSSAQAVPSWNVGIRNAVFKVAADEETTYKTASCEVVKNIHYASNKPNLTELREKLNEVYKGQILDFDSKRGMIFYASALNSLKMRPIKDNIELELALKKSAKNKIVHIGIGAANPEADPDEVVDLTRPSVTPSLPRTSAGE